MLVWAWGLLVLVWLMLLGWVWVLLLWFGLWFRGVGGLWEWGFLWGIPVVGVFLFLLVLFCGLVCVVGVFVCCFFFSWLGV
ncbi:hypothetical protein RA277_27905 [Pseudomonas syringae pv. tagetis]